MSRRQRLAALTAANSADLIRAFGLPANPVARALLWPPARRFARQVQHLDDLVAAGGLPAGARWALRTFTHSLTTIGREQVPLDGPLLAVANHPGLTDAMALVVALEARPDLKIVALDRQFLRAIPAVAARLLWVADHDRVALIHAARAHLADGALLLALQADPENLDRMEGVVGSHLVRFGTRDELVVEWVRAGGAAGTVQRKSED